MQITFSTRELKELCSLEKPKKAKLDKFRLKKLQQRLMEIRAVDSLADLYGIRSLRCHQLAGKRKGQYAVDIDEKYRIAFIIADDLIPRYPDGAIDYGNIREIEIIYVGLHSE